MAELEKELSCENCASKFKLIYDNDLTDYEPDNCPFCGDLLEVKWDIGEGFDDEYGNELKDLDDEWYEK